MSKEAKHTPGPWFATPTSGEYGHVSSRDVTEDSEGGDIATTWGVTGDAKAHARLIAAAPTMLEALKEARNLLAGDLTGIEWKRACHAFVAKADAAITLAEGRHP